MVHVGLEDVRRRMVDAAQRAGRDPEAIELVAISKGQGLDKIMAAYDAGHRIFGENRSDELVAKAEVLPPDIVWHFVGQLQSRKASAVARIAEVIHSVDRMKLIRKLAAAPAASDRAPLRSYVQVNLAGEEQKGGAAPADIAALLDEAKLRGLVVCGLMIIPPLVDDEDQTRAWFAELAAMRTRLAVDHPQLVELSMGMTDDFELAIEEGATAIRVGRAIFGERHGGQAAGLLHDR